MNCSQLFALAVKLIFFPLLLLTFCTSCKKKNLDVANIETHSIEKLLKDNRIEFIKEKEFWNGEVGLFGEMIDSTINTIYRAHYSIDWEKEIALPSCFYEKTPLRDPIFLVNKNNNLKIFTSYIGNTKTIDDRDLSLFDNQQVMDLKQNLIAKYGEFIKIEADTYQGNVYYWQPKERLIRLAISNECLCKKADIYYPKEHSEHPVGGRYGLLTVYYGIEPKFY